MNFLRKLVWYLISDQVEAAIAEFDEDLHDALFGSEQCGIESAIEVHVNELLHPGSTEYSRMRRYA